MELPSVVLNRKWGMSKCGYRREAEIEMYESTAGGLELNNRRRGLQQGAEGRSELLKMSVITVYKPASSN